jgi:hypothetical protein
MPKFTQYINQVKIVPPELLDAVAKALRAEMKKRGLWTAPPVWLGYEDWNCWDETRGKYKDDVLKKYSDAFIDLLFECYEYLFLGQRLPHLQNAMKQSPNVDGLVVRNIKQFITEKQRKHDPLGYNVAHHARDAVQCAIDKGILKASGLTHKGKVYNRTLLSSGSAAQSSDDTQKPARYQRPSRFTTTLCRTTLSSTNSTTLSEQGRIFEVLHDNQKWKDIRHKLAGKSEKVQERLCEIVCQLIKSGINCFRFENLVNAMKEDVRAINPEPKYISIDKVTGIQKEDTEIAAREPANDAEANDAYAQLIVRLDISYEDYHNYCDLRDRIREAIDKLPLQEKFRKRLHQILMEFENAIETKTKIPSQTELSKRLGVGIGTINKDIKELRKLVKKII